MVPHELTVVPSHALAGCFGDSSKKVERARPTRSKTVGRIAFLDHCNRAHAARSFPSRFRRLNHRTAPHIRLYPISSKTGAPPPPPPPLPFCGHSDLRRARTRPTAESSFLHARRLGKWAPFRACPPRAPSQMVPVPPRSNRTVARARNRALRFSKVKPAADGTPENKGASYPCLIYPCVI